MLDSFTKIVYAYDVTKIIFQKGFRWHFQNDWQLQEKKKD